MARAKGEIVYKGLAHLWKIYSLYPSSLFTSNFLTSSSTSSSSTLDFSASQKDMQNFHPPPQELGSDLNRSLQENCSQPHLHTTRHNTQAHPHSQPFVMPNSSYPGPTYEMEKASSSSLPYPHNQHISHAYPSSSAPPFLGVTTSTPGGSFAGSAGSYIRNPPPQPVNVVPQSRPTYTYSYHHTHNTSGPLLYSQNPPLMPFGPNTLVPMMQVGHPIYAPVPPPPHRQHSSEGNSLSSHSYHLADTAGGMSIELLSYLIY